jgi:hypothetical protein
MLALVVICLLHVQYGLFLALWRTKMLDESKMVQIMALGVVTVGLIFGIVLIMALDGVN